MNRPRVLLGSTEPPSVGGSSTASLDLFRRMLADGWDVHYVHLIDDVDAAYYQMAFGGTLGDAGDLPNVHHCCLQGLAGETHPQLNAFVESLDPQVVIGFGFLATDVLKHAAPARRTIFVTGTCRQAQDHVTSGRARDAIALLQGLERGTLVPRILNAVERRAVDQCDLVITHSDLTRTLFERFYAASIGKVYPTVISFAEWIADGASAWRHLALPFDERDIDVLFIASDWDRVEKNYPMVKAIANQIADLRVHVVGDVPAALPSATHHGFMPSREALFGLLGRARSIACPSLIDAAPGILFEGSVMGCNLVASKNCGNWEICHPDLVVDPFDAVTFARAIRLAAERRRDDHLDVFRQRGAYRHLMSVVMAMTQPFESEPA